MKYELTITPTCKKVICKYSKKNSTLEQALRKKIEEIIKNPHRFKNLRHDLVGQKRVHILKSFVLRFDINEQEKIITLLDFSHHDDAYTR